MNIEFSSEELNHIRYAVSNKLIKEKIDMALAPVAKSNVIHTTLGSPRKPA